MSLVCLDWYVLRPRSSNISSIMSVLLRLEWSQVLAYYVRPAAPGVESSISMCLIRMSYDWYISRPRSIAENLEASWVFSR
jgi:hypothetical protein